MNKEKFFAIRELEYEYDKCKKEEIKIKEFFKTCEDYIDDLKSKEAIEALIIIKNYLELLKAKEWALLDRRRNGFIEYQKECQHEIVFYRGKDFESRNPSSGYYCPLCREYLSHEMVSDDAMVIETPDLWVEEPDVSYKVIDYMIKNDLDYTAEVFEKVFKDIIPSNVYHRCKKYYKVREKK